jgi:uncharacterized protein YcbK (DUF882 family)
MLREGGMNEPQRHFLKLVFLHYAEGKSLKDILRYMKWEHSQYGSKVHPLLWIILESIRYGAGVPVHVTSHFRSMSDTTHGELPALGVDIRGRPSRSRMALHDAARAIGVSRIGHYCTDDHMHIDIGDLVNSEKWADEVFWLGKCPPREVR